jgi:uncharacterized protein YecE (DUF72 family)
MRLLAGTSGFSYKEWLGEFYPDKLPAKEMLAYYATRLPTVEINNTFYRMPNTATVQAWRSQVSDSFRFAVKAPQRISHFKRLRDCAGDLQLLFAALEGLGSTFGSLLVQLPPHARCDAAALAGFLRELPAGSRAAFEFRHDSWHAPEVFDLLRQHNAALVQSESDTAFEPLPWTADWAYLRLRRVDYTAADFQRWLERIQQSGVTEAQVFFKHEDGATGPKLATELLRLVAARLVVSEHNTASAEADS